MSEVQALRDAANELAVMGDVVSAMILDDIAWVLSRGFTWNQILDDVTVREPLVN